MIAALLLSGGVAVAALPAHPIYLNLDSRFYLLNGATSGGAPILRNGAGTRFIDIIDAFAVSNCRRAGGGAQTNTQVLMFYENSTRLVYLSNDRTRWRYQFGPAYNVFFLESSDGGVICDGEVVSPVPMPSLNVFRNGFEADA